MSRTIYLLTVLLLSFGFVTQASAQRSARSQRRAAGARPATVVQPASRAARKPAARGKQRGLIILLENAGVKANLPALDGKGGAAKLPMASCGDLHFALNPGESTARMVTRLGGVIGDNRRCLNPRAWRVRQVDSEDFTRLNSDVVIEEVAKGLSIAQNTRGQYDRVVVLEDGEMTPARTLAELRKMAARYVVDVHVLAHGGNEFFVGGKPRGAKQAATFGARFFEDIGGVRGLELGAVYQMNCVSGTLMDNWRAVGAKVVNGTVGTKNNYMPQQYYHFMRHWLAGAQFGYAIRESFKESSLYSLPAYRAFGQAGLVQDSRHVVSGAARLALKATRDTGYVVAETTKQTAVALAADLHSQGRTVAQMVRALLAAGHSLETTAKAIVRSTRCNTGQLVRGLLQAGQSDLDAIVRVTKSALGGRLQAGELCQALLQAQRTPTEVASLLKRHLGKSRLQVARLLHAHRCTARQIARALHEAMGATALQVADTLQTLKFSTRTIATALRRELGRGRRDVAIALQRSGAKLSEVVSAVRAEFRCNALTIAKDLRAAGCSLGMTAKAIWDAGQKSATALNALGQALASAYAQNLAQVMGTLASLGITA